MPLFGPPNVKKMKERSNIKGLIKALDYKKEYGVRKAAAGALGQIGDARAVEPLITALKDEDGYVRGAATLALGQIGGPAAEPLITALKDKHAYVRGYAAEALDKLGWEPDLDENGAQYWIAKREWQKCVEIGAPAVEPLITALKDKDAYMCGCAAGALGRIGDARAVEPLSAALKDEKWQVRGHAARALGQIGDARAGKPLTAALKDEDEDVRRAASEALDKLK